MAAKSHKNGSRVIPPGELTPELAQIAIEDTVLSAAADIAAIHASTSKKSKPTVMTAETPEEEAILKLAGIPYLGPVRLQALAAIGITTIQELSSASAEEIGSVKGVGMGNAARIKEWLSKNTHVEKSPKSKTPAPDLESEYSLPVASVQDDFGQIDQAIGRIKEIVPDDKRRKKLSKELEKISAAVSIAPEGVGVLHAKEKAKAAKALDKITKLLTEAVEKEKFSDKRQSAIGSELKDLRKRLEKSLGQ